MKTDNKEAGSDMKFLFWDDLGDSQEHVDKQKNNSKLTWAQEEEKLNERMRIISQNGNTGEHYPEYQDYMDESDEE